MSEADTLRLIHGFQGQRRDALILLTLYATGARASEVCSMSWGHWVAQDNGNAIVAITGKGDETRYVVVPASVWTQLQQYRADAADAAPVFPSRTGRHLTRSQINRIVTQAKQQGGYRQSGFAPLVSAMPHASHALHRGASVGLVKETLGHASLDTTAAYLHVSPDESSGLHLGL